LQTVPEQCQEDTGGLRVLNIVRRNSEQMKPGYLCIDLYNILNDTQRRRLEKWMGSDYQSVAPWRLNPIEAKLFCGFSEQPIDKKLYC
jgi:hypothetical protein